MKHKGRSTPLSVQKFIDRHRPLKTYVSLTRYLKPWRVGPLGSLRRAYPIQADYGLDIDGYMSGWPLAGLELIYEDVERARMLTLMALDFFRQYHEGEIKVIFTGHRGYQIWLVDWDWRGWAKKRGSIVAEMLSAKREFTCVVASELPWLDKWHVRVAEDLTRVFVLPGSINWSTGLTCVETDPSREDAFSLLLRAGKVSVLSRMM